MFKQAEYEFGLTSGVSEMSWGQTSGYVQEADESMEGSSLYLRERLLVILS